MVRLVAKLEAFLLRVGAALAGLALLAAPALAGNGISSITVTKLRTLSSAALEAIVGGDNDSTSVLRVFQRPFGSSAPFDTGMVMVRRSHGGAGAAAASGEIFEGRILWLTPGVTIEYFIEGSDAAGSLNTSPDTVSCSAVPQLVATGTVLYVNQATGSAGNSGLTPGSPKKTVNQALAAMRALADSGARGGVFVAPGEYHERFALDFGIDNLPRFIEGDGTNPDSTIICGANEEVETGNDHVGRAISWVKTDPSDGPDSVWVTLFTPGDSIQLVVLGWGELLHKKTSLKALFADSTYAGVPASPGGIGSGEASGWWWSNDSLYVKRRSGTSPTGLTLHVGYRDALCAVTQRNWRIANLTFRFAGSLSDHAPSNSYPSQAMNGIGVSAGIGGNAGGLAIDSCRFIGLNAAAIYIARGAGNRSADSVTVTNTRVDGLTVGGMFYGAAKSRPEENASQVVFRTYGSSFRNNSITGTFNGIGGDVATSDSLGGKFCEYSGNALTNIADDAFELDTSHNINSLFVGNTCRNTGSGFSLCAFYTGPAFIFYNAIVQFKFRGIKACGNPGQPGLSRVYHNTFTSTSPGDATNPGCWAIDASPGGSVDNAVFRNNIFVGRNSAATIYSGSQPFSTATNSLNYDVLDSLGTTRLVTINSTSYSLATLQSSLAWEANGAVGGIAFADSSAGKYWTSFGSRARDAGCRLSGINTFPTLARGAAPDAGAFEFPFIVKQEK